MIIINLVTEINAPCDVVFDLSRNIDVHMASTAKTQERAIDGTVTGLICLNDFVTWEARHFGVKQKLTVKITEFDRPFMFTDEMTRGAFKSMKHIHTFVEHNGITKMKDALMFEAPFGVLGKIVEQVILKRYMTEFLTQRNKVLKEYAEVNRP